MDPEVLAAMLFTIVLVAMIGGFILLLPVTRRLTVILERRFDRDAVAGRSSEEVQRLEAAVNALRTELEQLSERQAFTEALLSERQPIPLPKTGERSS